MYLFALGFAVVTTILFCLFSSVRLVWKGVAAGLVALSIILQFFFQVPFALPIAIQVGVGGWMLIYWKYWPSM